MHAKRVFERRSERQRRGPSVNEMNAERRTPRRNDDPPVVTDADQAAAQSFVLNKVQNRGFEAAYKLGWRVMAQKYA
ncbi:hypothetical protein [Methylocystis iwaonis]|uniref:Uncharacterized protein n=1 Tax=Methylocystis iwaonis TaxID=2885079 RepID=A0ABM8E8A2_9HYPH|nr:hypothetical protein [Methylocystis iwaonis]BDV34193.1 hypothetical protein SS37A_17220 [Methylocystis iwaonis]